MSRPRNENSERAIAERLTAATGLQIGISTVRRLKAKGVNLQDPEAVMHAFALQEKKPRRTNTQPAQKKSVSQPAPPDDADQRRPLSSEELDARLSGLEHELLMAPNYETGRSIRIKISGYRELVRVQKERGDLVDRKQVESESYDIGMLFKHQAMRFPNELIPMIVGLEYADAVEIAENWVWQMLTDIHEMSEQQLVPILEEMKAGCAASVSWERLQSKKNPKK